ncbi:MAG: nucleotidyltransferase domain-containing protein [Chloroflexi bacterium]|nr:nucleotidyltransferase domain-containing protein [Chloroflexota bacterium]
MNPILQKLQSKAVADYCRRWQVVELAVFGSVLRDDFSDESDVDLLLTFDDSAQGTLYEYVLMKEEMEKLLNRDVDLIDRRALQRSKNRIRREEIEQTAKTIYSEQVTVHA